MNICVIGLGYVGFPLAVQAAVKGCKVIGVDKNDAILEKVRSRHYFLEDPFVADNINSVSIEVSKEVISSEAYIICVPTPVSNYSDPDLSFVRAASEAVSKVIDDGQLVVIESTINPGVSEEVVAPILEVSGKEFLLAHCPERINPGDPKWSVANIPRVVGGINRESTKKAAELYKKIIDAEVMELTEIAAAESTKILENTFRDVNIAFINEMAKSFHKLGIDISEVIRGASTKPFGFLPHYPGVGVGGHCIAVDPWYMIERGKQVGFDHVFLKQARKINAEMPDFTVQLLQDGLNECGLPVKGTKIAVLGISYKPNIKDDRESPAFPVIALLKAKGAEVIVYDPHYPEMSDADSFLGALSGADAAVIITAHTEFLDESCYANLNLVVDGRNCLNKDFFNDKDVKYSGIGIRLL